MIFCDIGTLIIKISFGKSAVEKKQTFLAAIKDNERLIFRIASVYTNNVDDRQDLIQEIIYQLWKSFDSFEQRSSLSTWIYRAALNVAIYQLKVSKRKVISVPLEAQDVDYHDSDDVDSEEKWEIFRQQINDLSLLDKAIVTLYLDNKSYEEISDIIGISTSNVGTKLSRIREKLKKQILKKI